jgi:putative hemolysin
MSSIAFELVLLFALTLANGVFSMSEAALISARRARLQQAAEQGDSSAKAALAISQSPSRFLSTVQIGITLIGILQGAIAGNTIADALAELFRPLAVVGPYADVVGVAIVVLGTTFLSLVLGELVPKSIALNSPEAVASRVARPMNVLTRLTYPLVVGLTGTTNVVLKLLGVKPSTEPSVTEEEIMVMIEQGTQVGTFETREQDLIEQVLKLGDRNINVLMTPRTDVIWIDPNADEATTRKIVADSGFSFFPVASGSLDEVIGIARGRDILAQALRGERHDLEACMRQPLYLPESTPALKALEQFQATGNHMAIVLDEFGASQGLVTFNDILQSVFGAMPSLGSNEEVMVVRREDGSWLLDGYLPIDELHEAIDTREVTAREAAGSQTLGGFVMAQLGTVPAVGQRFTWNDFEFEVVDMDGRRVDKVLVTPSAQKPAAQATTR